MASLLTTVALCAGVAFAAALPSSAAPANLTLEANSTVVACSTVTSTQTLPWQNTVVETVTFNNTNTPEYTRLVSSYEATVTSSIAGYGTNTSTITVPGSTTRTKPASTEFVASACTSTETESAESTSTVYTGSYSSAVETHCPTATVNSIHYLQGEITETHTSTDFPDPTYVTKFIPAGTTTVLTWASERTKTVTSWATNSDVVSATRNGTCTTTVWTATAASATTQSAKCAPTNLITDVESFEQGDGYTQSAVRGYGLTAWKDASSCCQQCVENGDQCAAMSFTTSSQGGQCVLFEPSQASGAPAPHDIALVITKAKPDTGFQHGVVASGQKVIQSEN